MGRLGYGRRSPWWKSESEDGGCGGKCERMLYPELKWVILWRYDLDTFMAWIIIF